MPRRKPHADPAKAAPANAESTVTDPTSGIPGVSDDAVSPEPIPEGPAAQADAPSPDAADASPQRHWRRNLENLAVPEAGIYSGEDRKFAQVYIAFDKERPTDEQKAKMTEAGFRYRAAEKRWDCPATPVTRVAAKKLVAEFTGVTLGAAPGR